MKSKLTPQQAERAEKTRQRIVVYAHRLFIERGFRRVTIEELCVGLGMSKRTFYKFFANRDELVEAALRETIGRIAPAIIANLQSDRPAAEILTHHFELLQKLIFENTSVLFLADVQNLMPDLWQEFETARRGIFMNVVNVIRKGQQTGEVRPELDAVVFGKLAGRLISTLTDPSFLLSQGLSLTDVATTMGLLVRRGIFIPEGKS